MQKIKNKKIFWIVAGVLAALTAAPNTSVIKLVVADLDPVMLNVLRFGIIATLLTPYLIAKRTTLRGDALKNSLIAGSSLAVATITFVFAVKISQASYVSIMMLLSPIFFILLASKINQDSIDKHAFAGITLAALGACIIVLLPVAVSHRSGMVFYPFATVLALLTAAAFPLSIIYTKKAHLAGMAIFSVVGISAWVSLLASLLTLQFTGGFSLSLSSGAWTGIMYIAIVVQLGVRALNSAVYERLGAAANSVLSYLENFLAVLVPTIFLSEKLSLAMVLGGILILTGVYIVEHKKKLPDSKHHKVCVGTRC
jgi:drug/metabolite transporter (DMT)-like permease